jgi:uncharacterized membrane protein YphA (DoxX/SURF4 family)
VKTTVGNLSNTGRNFYGISIAVMGLLTIYYEDFPYMLFPVQPLQIPGLVYIFGILFILVGECIVFEIKIRPVSFLFGSVLLLIFCFYHLPYEFGVNSNYKNLLEWDNPGKELALAGGAFTIAGCFTGKNKNRLSMLGEKLMPFGAILFSIPIITFGILHLLFAKDVSTMVPSWIPRPVFWTYLAGIALMGSGIAIIFRIKTRFIAALLGSMIFIWFVILHIPRVIHSQVTDLEGEVTSAFLALAYSGIAFVIAGAYKKAVFI